MATEFQLDTRKLDEIIAQAHERLDRAGRKLVQQMAGDIQLSMGKSPSAPGDPPGVDTGTLRASIHWTPDGDLRWLIADGVDYGIHLELGSERMAARPFMVPVFEHWRSRVGQFLADEGIV